MNGREYFERKRRFASEIHPPDNFYRQRFAAVHIERNVTEQQDRDGIDVLVTTEAGRTLHVDEKIRDRPYQGDILVEVWSVWERKTPGWLQKGFSDYIVYYWPRSDGRIECFSVPDLQAAWNRHGEEWIQRYGWTIASNPPPPAPAEWHTYSVCIPTGVLKRAGAFARNPYEQGSLL